MVDIWGLVEISEVQFQVITTAMKIGLLFGLCANIPPIMVWAERRIPALMQRRKGPNRVGFFKFRILGLFQPLADTIKLIFKEEVVPEGANKFFYHAAPVFSLFPALLVAAAIPFGKPLHIFGQDVSLNLVNLDVGFLYIFAISSIAVYGITLAGWSCNNKYSLMGALRAAAQMISYEIPLGMSLIPIVLIFGTLNLSEIVELQTSNVFSWGFIYAPLSFLLFLICMFAETNRAPFDLAEAEAELVAGFHTEYNSFKFSMFFFGEYVSMFVLSCLASTVFFGGYQIPFVPFGVIEGLLGYNLAVLSGFIVLLLKATFFMWLYVWVRWTLPRFRYDQLMSLGWRFMLPLGLANILITSFVLVFTSSR